MIVCVSVSGGRTSGYMAAWMVNNRDIVADHLGIPESELVYDFDFANTGMEHEDTLRFMRDVDEKLLGGQVTWLESVPNFGQRKSSGHRVVSYETAARFADYKSEDHPFHANIIKYGLPNQTWQICTRELKLNAMTSYRREKYGLGPTQYMTAIGIREDEAKRVNRNAKHIFYPLVDLEPVDKQDVVEWFKQFDWDLNIPEWQGNCVTCFKKSFKKLNKVWLETPEVFEAFEFFERNYGTVGAEFDKGEANYDRRVFFREHRSSEDMIALFRENPSDPGKYINIMNDAGCSEECGIYDELQLEMAV